MADDTTGTLVAAAEAAARAPSIHNTQPWRWRVHSDAMDLHADRDRQLGELDPAGHLLLLSCGAALQHARVALAAEGWAYEVSRPAAQPLARLRITGPTGADPTAMRRFQATLVRRTDRRPASTDPVTPSALDAVTRAVQAEHERLHVLRPEQVIELAAAAHSAMRAEDTDERQRAELARWVGGARPEGTGIPDSAIPAEPPRTTVPGRDFGVTGTLPIDAGHDKAAVYAVLYGDGDTDADWLRAGEALSAAWLDAVDHGLNLLPISVPVEIAHTRYLLRDMLAGVGYPHVVVRLGVADPDHTGPGHTPRLPGDQTIEVVTGAAPSVDPRVHQHLAGVRTAARGEWLSPRRA
jgi:nitroreductase